MNGYGRLPIDITVVPEDRTLRLSKEVVKDVKSLILLDLSLFLAC